MLSEVHQYKVVLGVIGADCHAVGNKILAKVLPDYGILVENLGVMVSQVEFIEAAAKTGAQAILVSSIYGHGEIDCVGLKERCDEAGLFDVLLYVGGNLVIGKRDFEEVEASFKEMGYDRVFQPECSLADVAAMLKQDIDDRRNPAIGHNAGPKWTSYEVADIADSADHTRGRAK